MLLIGTRAQVGQAMQAARFKPAPGDPGVWYGSAVVDGRKLDVTIDLILPEAAAPPGGRRGARLGAHGKRAARRAVGLEAALVDHSPMTVVALEESVGARLSKLRQDPLAGPATEAAIGDIRELFGRRRAEGMQMAIRALRLAIPEAQVVGVTTDYMGRLEKALG